jgi:hypothetical protein
MARRRLRQILKQTARQVMTRLVAILATLFLVAIPAKADVTLWPRPVPGWWLSKSTV